MVPVPLTPAEGGRDDAPALAPDPPAAGAPRWSRWTARRRSDALAAVLFLAPVLVLIVVLRVVPVSRALLDSLHEGLPGSLAAPDFVGWDNFARLWDSPQFWFTLRQTLIFNLIVNPVQIALALALAVLLTRGLPAAGLWRTLIFLPAAVPLAGSTIVWGIALRPDGPVNGALALLALPSQPFLTSPDQVILSMVLLTSWIGIGYWMVFLIAGIDEIPRTYYEAATMDGAGPVSRFIYITLPLLRRPLLFVLVADTVSNFVLFAPVHILTDGGPQRHSNFLMYDIFRTSFEMSDPYAAAAKLVVLLLIMTAIVALQFRLLRSPGDER